MTPAEKEQLWNCIVKMRSMPWKGPRGGTYNWTQREMRNLYQKLVVYGDNNQPAAAWRLLNEGKYKYMIYPWYKAQLYKCAGFSPNCLYSGFFDPYNFAGYSSFTGWTLNGNDLLTELNSIMSLYAGSVWAGFVDNSYFIFYGTWFYYYGPDLGQLDFTAPDTTVYPVVMTPVDLAGLSCNTLKCYQVEITGTAIKLYSVFFASALGGTSAIFTNSPPSYANIDSDDQVTLQQLFQLMYGPQCYVSILTIGGNDTITIYDAYDFGPPTLSNTIGGTYTGTYITC